MCINPDSCDLCQCQIVLHYAGKGSLCGRLSSEQQLIKTLEKEKLPKTGRHQNHLRGFWYTLVERRLRREPWV